MSLQIDFLCSNCGNEWRGTWNIHGAKITLDEAKLFKQKKMRFAIPKCIMCKIKDGEDFE